MPLMRNRARPTALGSAANSDVTVQWKDLLGADDQDARLSTDAMKMLLCSIGLLLDVRQGNLLVERAKKITKRQDGGLCFADFLLLMRWMLDTNFADINFQAEKLLDRVKKSKSFERSANVTPDVFERP